MSANLYDCGLCPVEGCLKKAIMIEKVKIFVIFSFINKVLNDNIENMLNTVYLSLFMIINVILLTGCFGWQREIL